MDDESRDLSLKLSKILEKVGVSERIRQLRRDIFTRNEIQRTITLNMTGQRFSVYIFGSSMEGTTTRGMQSDQDIVHCDESLPVTDHIQQSPSGHNSQHLLVVTDDNTRPGYVKLQFVKNGILCTVDNCNPSNDDDAGRDNNGRICLKHRIYRGDMHTSRGGPAETVLLPGIKETDMVYAVRSRAYHDAAIETLLECARAGWLTMDDVEEMKQYGCLYVGVGHPASTETEFEWRISFSLQERKLMFRLNPTQHQCYVLLKFIKSMVTSEPDIGKSITSYHCKTCLFKLIAKTRPEKWIPENLIVCTLDCLSELLQCLCNGACPNFFIKGNNMFEHRVYGEVRERLIHCLSGMINEGYHLFYRIPSDNIGEVLSRGNVNRKDMEMSLIMMQFGIYKNAFHCLGGFNTEIGKYLKRQANENTQQYLDQQVCYLSSSNTITEHTQEETKAAVQELEPIIHRFYSAHLACLAFSTAVHESKHRLLEDSVRHLQHAIPRDLMCGKLLHATILYRQEDVDTCCDLLDDLKRTVHKTVQTLCGCYHYQTYGTDHERILILSRYPDPQSMWKSSVAACMVFLPSHTEIIPTALQYEFYRSLATPPESRVSFYDDWMDLAVVDSKIYLYFLQYLVNSRLNIPDDTQLATDNLRKQLQTDQNLGHRETGYNLLGWINIQEGKIEAAVECFVKSWAIRPHHNAAKWHMLNLIYRQYVASVSDTCS